MQTSELTCPCLIKACAGLLDLCLEQVIPTMTVKMDLIMDVFVGDALIVILWNVGLLSNHDSVWIMPNRILFLEIQRFVVLWECVFSSEVWIF